MYVYIYTHTYIYVYVCTHLIYIHNMFVCVFVMQNPGFASRLCGYGAAMHCGSLLGGSCVVRSGLMSPAAIVIDPLLITPLIS